MLSAEDLILLKLVAFRPKDTFDLETVIDAVGPKLDLGYLRQWASRLGLGARLEALPDSRRRHRGLDALASALRF